MKKNDFFSLWLRAFSCTTTMTMLFTALMALMANTTKTFAQTLGTTFAQDFGTTYDTADNIDDLVGIDPSNEYLTETNTLPTENKKVLCFYNVGAKRFLSPGGYWGTHASLDNTAHAIWMKKSDNPKAFILVNNVAGSGTGTFLGNGTKDGYLDLYMDRGGSNDFVFEEAPGYNAKNKVYYVKMKHSNGKYYYVQAYPDDDTKYCNISLTQLTDKDDNYKNQEWKIITKEEYYSLLLANPANMEDVIDFSFIMKSPNFRVNDTDIKYWMAKGTDQIKYGDSQMYRPYKAGGLGNWVNKTETQQKNFGKLFYSYAKGAKNFEFYQDIKVDKDGWYLLRCNGFTTQLNHNGKVSAHLMMAVVKNGSIDKTAGYSAATLNKLSVDAASKLMADDATGQGAGLAFFNGKYENQVQVCLDEKYLKDMGGSVTLRIGYYVDNDCELKDGDVTCVDNFKLLYAGPRRNPELILDEDQPSLVYLSNAKDVYKNSVLHLKRTFTEGQWNSLILPVDLKFGQMKRTFGDDVKVAKLTSLKNNVVIFRTVEPKQDDEVMVKAFEPYIIKPTSLTEDMGLAYTAEKFYTRLMDGSTSETNNAYWLGKDGKSESHDPNDRFELRIPNNHYDIFMVTLDRDALVKHLNLSETDQTYYNEGKYDLIDWDKVSWMSQTSFSTGAKEGDLTCYGTLAKTYGKDENGKDVILPGRDNLRDDYVMRGGKIVHVPNDKDYGLKGFRCWFEVKGKNDGVASAPRLEIDGIIDDATSIDDLNSQPSQFTSRHKGISGVFNLDGQKVRDGESTQDLPKGIYIVNGRKVVVR